MNNKIQKTLILAVAGLLAVVLSVVLFLTLKNNREYTSLLSESVKSELISISIAANEYIDASKFESYNSINDIRNDVEAYNDTLDRLRSLQEKVGATYIYALKEIDGKYYFIFDTDPETAEIFSEYELSNVHEEAFLGIESADVMNVVDQWGSFNTGAVPILLDGKIIGIISTDIEDAYIRASQETALLNIVVLITLLLLVMGAIILLIRRVIVEPFKNLTGSIAKADTGGNAIYGTDRNDEFGVLARTIQEMTRGINHRDFMLSTVNQAVNILLQAEINDFNTVLWSSMGMMAKAVDADRMYIWKNHIIDKKLYCTQLYEWSEGAIPQQGNEFTIDIAYDENIPSWEERFKRNECVNNIVRNMSEVEQAQLLPQGILSILVVPVYVRDYFWGFIGFDDCHNERLFTENEESILRSGSLLIANVLLRRDMTQKLESSLDKAQAGSKAKSDFLANMSHEIRTPMNAIIGMTHIAKSADSVERRDYAFEKIEDASIHLLGIINNILDMSKIEADKLELNHVAFVFEEMLNKVVSIINFKVVEKHQNIDVYIDENIPLTLICDDQRLSQVIANLLSNATKFTPEHGSISIHVKLIEEEANTFAIQFDVADTGIGISEEQQLRLFNAFEQAESSTTRKFGGTGLGLSITKRIVELMGGEVSVSSVPGEGSTFSFTVKAEKTDEETEDRLLSVCNANADDMADLIVDGDGENNEKGEKLGSFWGYRVLLTEDVEINREIVLALLEPTLIDIDCAENGAQAVKMFSAEPKKYNLIFMDIQMPVMDGYEATQRIRGLDDEWAKEVPIIAMTANAFKEDIENCLQAGMDGHIGKPIDFDEVLHTLRQYLFLQEPIRDRRKSDRRKSERRKNTSDKWHGEDKRRGEDRRQNDKRRREDRRQNDRRHSSEDRRQNDRRHSEDRRGL